MMTMRRDANTVTIISLAIGLILILSILGYASVLTKTSTATHTGSRMPAYVTGVYPAPANLQKGYAASFPTIAELKTHLLYTIHEPRHLPPAVRLVSARIEPDMATVTLVYSGSTSALRVSEIPIIVNTREQGSRPVRVHGTTAYELTTATSSMIVWIRRPLKYIVVASGRDHTAEAARVMASL